MHISFSSDEIDYSQEIYQILLLADRERVDAYRTAIERTVKSGDVVADLGCGSGCLGRLAIAAGAAKVIMIDREPKMLNLARSLNQILAPGADIEYVLGDAREVISRYKFDVVVSEIIGSLGSDEGMGEILWKFSRNNLRSEGLCCPRHIQVFGGPCRWSPERKVDLFDDTSGGLFRGYHVEFNPKTLELAGKPKQLFEIPGRGHPTVKYRWTHRFGSEKKEMNAYAVWFKAVLAEDVVLQSGPKSKMSHWGTAVIPIDDHLLKNGTVALTFTLCSRSGQCQADSIRSKSSHSISRIQNLRYF